MELASVERGARSDDRLLRIAEVRSRTSLSTSTIYRKLTAGTFPTPIKLGERATAWLESDITAWIAERIAESRSGMGPDKRRPPAAVSGELS
jgi:prophage regulatory protein